MAEEPLIEPVKVQFWGGDADAHRMDALLLGQSLSGIARLYNSVGHQHFHGQLRTSEHSQIRVQAGPPAPGSIFYLIYMMIVHGKMPLYPEVLFSLAEIVIPAFVKAIIAKKTGQNQALEQALQIINRQSVQYHEAMRSTQDKDAQTIDNLIGLVRQMTAQNQSALSDMAAPVGKTIHELKQLPAKSDPIVIDAPMAEALRSPEDLVVGTPQEFRGCVVALDTRTGIFKLEEQGSGKLYRGKITDPALSVPENIYSHALDKKHPVTLIGKPTIKEGGEIHKIFVSDARND